MRAFIKGKAISDIPNLKWKNPKRSAQYITGDTDDYHLKLKNARVLEETILVGIAWSRVWIDFDYN